MLKRLAELFENAVQRNLEEDVGVSFSGGLDSTLIAHVAKKYVSVSLFTSGTENSQDVEFSKVVASLLNLPLDVIVLDEQKILSLYKKCYDIYPSNLLKVEILVPLYAAAERARRFGLDVLLFGSGSEELFVGYERYYRDMKEGKDVGKIVEEEFRTLPLRDVKAIKKICWSFGIEARFPFLDKTLSSEILSIPVEERMGYEMKKGLLREVGTYLRAPEVVLKREKKAAQYGSNVHKILLKNSAFINKFYQEKTT